MIGEPTIVGARQMNISDLDAWIDESIRVSKRSGYNPTTFIAMRGRHGTKEAIQRLVLSGDIQSGFRKLKELELLNWSIEAAVAKFPDDFPNREVREAAEWRLRQV
jgi:hypothetical protein